MTSAPGPAASTTEAKGTRALWLAGVAMLAGVLLLLIAFPYIGNETELLDLRKMAGAGWTDLATWLSGLVLLTGGWIGGMIATRDRSFGEVAVPATVITTAVLAAMLATYPGTAIDVYIYAARSHLLTDYGLNPSTALPEILWEFDPYVQYASSEWADRPSPYGPLWNLVAAPATAFDGDRIGTAVLVLKAIMLASTAAAGALVYDIARRVQPRLATTAMLGWLWCPVVLWEGIANGHNDALLALVLIAAFWCWYRGYLAGVLPLLGAAALLKVVAVIIIPAAIVAIWRHTGWNRRLITIAWQTAALSIGVLWIAFMPFFDIRGTIDAIRTQATVMVTSPALLVQAMSNEYGWGLDVRELFPRFSTPVIALLTIGGAVLAWRRPAHLPIIAFEQLFWFIMLATSNLRPWYTIWLIALAVVLPLGLPLMRAGTWVVSALSTYAYLLWIQHWFGAEWLVEVSITVALMVGPPLVVTAWAAVRSWRTRRAASSPSQSTSMAGAP